MSDSAVFTSRRLRQDGVDRGNETFQVVAGKDKGSCLGEKGRIAICIISELVTVTERRCKKAGVGGLLWELACVGAGLPAMQAPRSAS